VKTGSKGILGDLPHLLAGLRKNNLSQKYLGEEPPLRSELFSASQMEQHGKALAGSHALSTGHDREHLLTRLAENEGVLLEVRDLLTEAVKANRRITPAGGMAARQLLSHRGTDTYGQETFAEGLQQRTAPLAKGSVSRTAPRI